MRVIQPGVSCHCEGDEPVEVTEIGEAWVSIWHSHLGSMFEADSPRSHVQGSVSSASVRACNGL